VSNVWLNRTLTGEYGLNAAVAGYFAVPVLMISGDQTACAQAVELLGPLETAVVKQARGRYAAECLTPPVAQEQIQASARRAVERLAEGDAPDPYVVDTPVTITVEFMTSDQADRASRLPDSRRVGLRLTFSAPDMLAAYASFRAAVSLALG
jgi:D-amino peptidase